MKTIKSFLTLGLRLAAIFIAVLAIFGIGFGAEGAILAATASGVIAGETASTEAVDSASSELNLDTILKEITYIAPARSPIGRPSASLALQS